MRLHLLQAGRSLRGGESWPALARRCEALLQMPLRTESHRSGQAAQQTLQVRPFVLLSSLSGFTALMQNNMRVKWVLFCRSSNCGLFKWERDGMLKVKSLLFRSFKERKQKKNRIIHCCERNRPDVALDVFFFFLQEKAGPKIGGELLLPRGEEHGKFLNSKWRHQAGCRGKCWKYCVFRIVLIVYELCF